MATTKRIGLVDDDLNNFHANTYLKAIHGPLGERGYQIAGAFGLQSEPSASWAEHNDVPYFESVGELAPEVDCFAILAPSTPETHLGLCQQVFPHGKPTFVDKTFAPDEATAVEIFSLADQAGIAVQSTSALRTTAVQRAVAELEQPLLGMNIWAGGASFDEYGVHPVEIAISCLGSDVQRLTITGGESDRILLLAFSENRAATINFNATEYVPFRAALNTAKGTHLVEVDDQALFVDAAAAILDFFDAGRPLIPRAETLAVMQTLDAAKTPAAHGGWVSLKQ